MDSQMWDAARRQVKSNVERASFFLARPHCRGAQVSNT